MKIKKAFNKLTTIGFSIISLCLLYLTTHTSTQASTQYLVQTSSRLGSGPTALQILSHSSWEPANTWFSTSPAPNFVTIGDNYYQFEYWTVNGQLKHGNPIELYMNRRHSAVAIYKDVPEIRQKIRIVHLGDLNDHLPEMHKYFQLFYNYNTPDEYTTIFLGSGDYVNVHQDLPNLKTVVDRFLNNTRFTDQDLILALGNHDDPGRISENKDNDIWGQIWNQTRPHEDVVIKDNLLIAWIHTEKPYLNKIEELIQEKRQQCPNCVAIMIGHKPLILGQCFGQFESFLLPLGLRTEVFRILKDYNFDFYLTGHLEYPLLSFQDGTLHNRVTPAKDGFEEILFEYVNGEIKDLKIITRDYNFQPTVRPLPIEMTNSLTSSVSKTTPTPTPTPIKPSSTCHQICNTNNDCQSGQTCARNYNIRPDGAMICVNFSCPAETDCKCAWQR